LSPTAPAGYSYTGVSIPAGERWQNHPRYPTGPIWYPSAAGYAGKVYVFGGWQCDSGGGGCADLAATEIFDTATRTWSPGAALPSPREAAAAVELNGLIYLIGGANYPSIGPTEYLSRVDVYDPVANTWSSAAAMSVPREACAAAVIAGKIYVVGGYYYDGPDNFYWNTGEVYDPAANVWSPIADSGVGGYAPTAVALNGKLLKAGGYFYDDVNFESVYVRALEEYDPTTDAWTQRAELPNGRTGASGGAIDGIFYLAGGDPEATNLRELLAYDPLTDAWSSRAAPLDRRAYGVGAVVGRRYRDLERQQRLHRPAVELCHADFLLRSPARLTHDSAALGARRPRGG
jgi:N-acetylneuraminic acid mutarotase